MSRTTAGPLPPRRQCAETPDHLPTAALIRFSTFPTGRLPPSPGKLPRNRRVLRKLQIRTPVLPTVRVCRIRTQRHVVRREATMAQHRVRTNLGLDENRPAGAADGLRIPTAVQTEWDLALTQLAGDPVIRC